MSQYGQAPPHGQGYGQQPMQQQYHPQQYGQQTPPQGHGQYPLPQQVQPQGHGQYPPQAQPQTQAVLSQSDSGTFQGGSYSITHRDTNAVLNIDLQQGGAIVSKPGAMIHMAGTVQLTGQVKFSMKKMFTGGQMAQSTYAGHGRVALAPTLQGDIITLHVDGNTRWKIGRDAFLACTQGVIKESKTQGFGKALFSGEDLFVYHISGQGLMWLTSFGAVDRLDLRPGEQHIVDNGHLVAWSCDYRIEKAGGGAMTGMKTGEGLVCRFTGPGSIYVQTRNMADFEDFIKSCAGGQ